MDQWQWNASNTSSTWNRSFLSLELDPRNQSRPMTAAAANRWCEMVMLFAINSVGAGILCFLGLLGNGISFAILSQDRTTSPVAAFLLESLSMADSAFLVVWLLQFSVKDLFTFFGLDRTLSVAYIYTRAYTYPLAFIAQTATIWLTVLIAASRYVAVCIPYRASAYCTLPVTRRGTLGVALFAVLYNLPRFFENEIAVSVTRRNVTRYQLQRTPMGHNHLYQLVYFDALYYVVSFVLPLLLLSVFNAQLIVAYRAVQRKRSAMTVRRRCRGADSHEQNITLVMIVVILVFMVCNAPARVVQILWAYNQKPCPTVPFFVIQLSNVLEVFSSSSNFLVYCGFRKQFRRALRMRMTPACATTSRSRDLSDETTVNATDGPLATDCGGDETDVQQSVL